MPMLPGAGVDRPTARITRPKPAGVRSSTKAVLVNERGTVEVVLPYAPVEVEHSVPVGEYATRDRQQQEPLLIRVGTSLGSMRLELLLANPKDNVQAPLIRRLGRLAAGNQRVKLRYGPTERGWWRITDAGFVTTARNENNRPTRAVYFLELTRPSDPKVKARRRGPRSEIGTGISGGTAAGKVREKGKDKGRRRYVVKDDDRLWSIAVRFYNDGPKWRRIADANGIKDATKLPVGMKLTIP